MRQAFTMIEVMITLSVLALGAVAALQLISRSSAIGVRTSDEITASYLARDLLDEISSKHFRDPQTIGFPADPSFSTLGIEMNALSRGFDDRDGNGSVDRANFDDVDDYDGYTSPTAGPVDVLQGVNLATSTTEYWQHTGARYDVTGDGVEDLTTADFGKFTQVVAVVYVDDDNFTSISAVATETKMITVVIYWRDPKAPPVLGTALGYDSPPESTATYNVRTVILTGIKTNYDE